MNTAADSKARRMRVLLEQGIIVSPGVYDCYSARLVEKMGMQAAATTGGGLSNSRLGENDIGLMSLMENVAACRVIARSVSIPLMADADTGYGNAVTVYHAVRHFEEAGVAGINLEDQVSPKRCGHVSGAEIIGIREAAKKIEAAANAKRDADFIINARTDALAVEGLDAAIKRAQTYVAAGADMIYPEAIRSEDEIKRFVDEVKAPISINMGFGLRSRPTTPLIPVKRLAEMGVARVSLPRMLTASALMGMHKALEFFMANIDGDQTYERADMQYGIEDINSLMNYDEVHALETQFRLDY